MSDAALSPPLPLRRRRRVPTAAGGRPTFYPGKIQGRGWTVLLTPVARAALADVQARTGMSVSDVFEALLRKYGAELSPDSLP